MLRGFLFGFERFILCRISPTHSQERQSSGLRCRGGGACNHPFVSEGDRNSKRPKLCRCIFHRGGKNWDTDEFNKFEYVLTVLVIALECNRRLES